MAIPLLVVTMAVLFVASSIDAAPARHPATIHLKIAGSHASGRFNEGAAKAAAYVPSMRRLFVVNGATDTLDILDVSDPAAPKRVEGLPPIPLGEHGSPTFVAAKHDLIAVTLVARPKTKPGSLRLYDADGHFIRAFTVGAAPSMVVFTPDGRKLLVANEAGPEADIDPEGSVSIIDLSEGVGRAPVASVEFVSLNHRRAQLRREDVHFVSDKRTVAESLEPKYLALAPDGTRGYVSLQENNAVAVIDVERARLLDVFGLGLKDYRRPRNQLDASDVDRRINIRSWPVLGMYQPDGIAAYRASERIYLVTANEGERRPEETARVADLTLDPKAFRDREELQKPQNLGRLFVSRREGDHDGDGDFDALHAFGGRSFAIWTAEGRLVWDSGDALERITAETFPRDFNARGDANVSFDRRSDLQGPQPEGIALGRVDGRAYVFIGLSQIGGVVVYDITDPSAPRFIEYVNNRNFNGDPTTGTAGDLGPSGLLFIPAEDAPGEIPLLVVANEVSGTITLYRVTAGPPRQ